ncbi:aldo/keto reductase [Clostridium carnis]
MRYINKNRYENMEYRRCGNSGLMLPAISLGFWHNFGEKNKYENMKEIVKEAFNNGINHFDIADCYGPPYGAAEENLGKILKSELNGYRDEISIATKAGFDTWDGPYGDYGSKKHLVASIDQSLKRLGVEYVDIFYHHVPDNNTPLYETLSTLDLFVKQGKALYIGISNYDNNQTSEAIEIFNELGTPFIVNQIPYSMLNRDSEFNLMPLLEKEKKGMVAFIPLAQGLLTGKYLNGIPKDSRAAIFPEYFVDTINNISLMEKIRKLNEVAKVRNQTLAQMAISWSLRNKVVSTVLVGASKASQIRENILALKNMEFSKEELQLIEKILN